MAAQEQTVEVDGRRIRLSHLDKVLYPATGTTKAEVIDYYARIAPLLLPHVAGRPVTRKRWPDGVAAEPFFAKNLERGAPAWLARAPIAHTTGTKDYVLVDDVATLVWLGQTASLELHTPQWRFDRDGEPKDPDRLVLDLDPGDGVDLATCAEVARWARAILSDMGLAPLPVTSGSKGIHLYCTLPTGQTSEAASALAKELARALEADHPDLIVSSMSRALRPGKVFVDWSQNNGKKTTIAPYSLRGRDLPTVAAPRTWGELADPRLAQLTFAEVLERAADGDPLAPLDPRRRAEPLRTYLAKRTAGRTPEPVPDAPHPDDPSSDGLRFVIQEHHARRLHYDLRLEHDGVFVSWAVPKGVPTTTSRNHLAVMTEDHPLAYGAFEGTIPAGEYGAGTVTIWDAGTVDVEKWRRDEVIATLHGREGGPLGDVRIALIRTDGDGETSSWLLHRMSAAPASAASDEPREPWPAALAPARLRPMLAESATPALARAAAERWGAPWAEIKWDGVRALAFWDGTRMRLRARSGTDITERYPELTADPGLSATPCVLDGEIVALDERGRPSFPLLQSRMHLTRAAEIRAEAARVPVRLHVFDLLSLDGDDITASPLSHRRALLEQTADRLHAPWILPPVFDDVDAALAASGSFALEGIAVKNPRGPYRAGVRSEDWLKVKHVRTREVVIIGIRPGRGGRGGIGSLLVAVPDQGRLRYAGRVGSGFSDAELRRLDAQLTPLAADHTDVADVPAADASDAHWIRPELVAEVGYAEMTPDGRLRQARWRGLRPDKSPAEINAEG